MKRWGPPAVAIAALALCGPVQASAPPVQAQAYVVESTVDGRTLAARDADTSRPMASITKLMTVLVALEKLPLDRVVTVTPVAARVGESSLELDAGDRLPVRDLVIGALVPSANDAATALAVAAAGSVPRFVTLMNRKAHELGLTGTHYRNPHGLDEPGHVSTARDVATLLRVALRNPVIRRYAGAAQATLSGGRVVESTDNLIRTVPGIVGGKTGHTSLAGWSQVAYARVGGVGITAAVLGEPSVGSRDASRCSSPMTRKPTQSTAPTRCWPGRRRKGTASTSASSASRARGAGTRTWRPSSASASPATAPPA